MVEPFQSALYKGRLRHRRREPVRNEFTYPIFLCYLDLEEIPRLFDGRWLWSTRGPNLCWFRRRDYLGDPEVSLDETIRQLVEERSGERPRGPIRLLTNLRTFGVRMNPASFYYCFDEDGTTLEHLVVEITNTPWGERYCYVLSGNDEDSPARIDGATVQTVHRTKVFHVSPFMPMEQQYRWRFAAPGERLLLHVDNLQDDRKLFDATVDLERRPWNGRELARALGGYPLMTVKVAVWIYLQAFKLWWRKVPFHSHPKHGSAGDLSGPEPLGGFSHDHLVRSRLDR